MRHGDKWPLEAEWFELNRSGERVIDRQMQKTLKLNQSFEGPLFFVNTTF